MNWKPSLIKLALNQNFNLKFCDHDIPFSESSVSLFFSSDVTINIENCSRMNDNNLRTVGFAVTTIIFCEHNTSLPFYKGTDLAYHQFDVEGNVSVKQYFRSTHLINVR